MAYKAVIELLIDVENYSEACDAVAEMLRDHLRQNAPDSVLVDWRYVPHSSFPDEFGPIEVTAIPPDFTEDSDWPPKAPISDRPWVRFKDMDELKRWYKAQLNDPDYKDRT